MPRDLHFFEERCEKIRDKGDGRVGKNPWKQSKKTKGKLLARCLGNPRRQSLEETLGKVFKL
jgi:hypothetical protein